MMGPLISAKQRERVLGYIEKGKAEGATLAVGGGRPSGDEFAKGWWVEPTLFTDVDNAMTIAQEEIFGPVLVVIPYEDEDDAVRIANDSKYGLQGRRVLGDARALARRWPGASAPAASASTAARRTGPTSPSAATSTAASAARTAWPASSSTSRPSRWPGRRPRPGSEVGDRVTVTSEPEVYYDPYDFEIDADPYPVWKRLRDEAPLYWNEKYEFFALSRWDDVDAAMLDWKTYISGRGSVLEIIKAGVEIPPGSILFEDPPTHDLHRGLLSRVFTPKKMQALEPQVRAFCAQVLDPLVGSGHFDFVEDLGRFMPMRVIGMLLGIPEQDQAAIRDRLDEGLRLEEGVPSETEYDGSAQSEVFSDYVTWRAEHPSDDLMTELLNAEFEDDTGTTRTLTHEEILGYVGLLAGAGNETTTRLIGFTGEVLGRHPDQRAELVADRSLIPNTIEELLRYESPVARAVPLRDQRRRAPRPDGARGQRHGAAERVGQPRRAALPRRRQLRHPS